jgi:hypothetical protein
MEGSDVLEGTREVGVPGFAMRAPILDRDGLGDLGGESQ